MMTKKFSLFNEQNLWLEEREKTEALESWEMEKLCFVEKAWQKW